MELYRKYSEALKEKYGQKVYKLPINLNISCPNRDGTLSTKGCYFCSELGAGFESLHHSLSIEKQLKNNQAYISKKYNAQLFSAYFQNYTNTHMPIEQFQQYMEEACLDFIVEIVVSTRPDCISKPYLEVLLDISKRYQVNISIELGLQSTNDESLVKVNRGHTVADYIEAVQLIRQYPFEVCSHLILNLPWDEDHHAVEASLLMNTLQMDQVKLHALYIAKGTVFEKWYHTGEITLCSMETYIRRVILFLEHLSPDTVIQRLIGRAPEEETVFCNWNTSWWKIHDEIQQEMLRQGTYQGKYFNKKDDIL